MGNRYFLEIPIAIKLDRYVVMYLQLINNNTRNRFPITESDVI